MQKIISLFVRDWDGNSDLVTDAITPGAEWVAEGQGVATIKLDGTCCRILNGVLYKRYEVKCGKQPPVGFEPASDVDSVTGKQQGWLLVTDCPADQWHIEAMQYHKLGVDEADGAFELCGPKIQGNPENLSRHCLIRHGYLKVANDPRTYAALKQFFAGRDIEGIVWHHPRWPNG